MIGRKLGHYEIIEKLGEGGMESFEEANSVFGDPLTTTVRDALHSKDEARFLTTGLSSEKRELIVWPTERDNGVRVIDARDVTAQERRVMSPKNDTKADDMRPEYDIRGGVRGKYFERYREGTNVVLLQPDVAAVFRSSAAVNRALRELIEIARRQTGAAVREGSD